LLSNEFFPSQNTPKSMSAGAWPQTLMGELTALPQTLSWFQGSSVAAGGEWREGEGRTRGKERNGAERGNGEGGEKGKVGGIAPWLLGG